MRPDVVVRALLGWLIATLVSITVAPPAAHADGCPPGQTQVGTDPNGNMICAVVTDPGQPGDPGDDDPGGGGSTVCHDNDGKVIPCSTSAGGYDYIWFGAPRNCYGWLVTPPPPAGNPVWGGHDPSEGNIYTCDVTACGVDAGCAGWFVPGGTTPPSPGEMAQSALGQMHLAVPDIHTAPQPPLRTYVGLETWLWMDPAQWDPLRLRVAAGATSVTVTATPVAATWDLTGGSTTCTSAGRAWVKGMSSSEQTDCSYTFDRVSVGQPDGEFPLTSTLTYRVDWTCSGVCLQGSGTLGQVDGLPGNAAIRVGERQSVVIH